MKQFWISLFSLLFLVNALVNAVNAQETPARNIYVIFDASGSMWGKLSDDSYKIHTARSVLEDFISQDHSESEIAFRAYGHRREGDCSDTELIIPFGKAGDVEPRLRTFLKEVNPKGKTPIHRSLAAALEDFGDRAGDIVLITDGIETCNADPCALMREWREKNVNINVHVVGFGLEEKEKEALACISKEAGTPFYEAESAQDLTTQLQSIKEVSTVWAAFNLKAKDTEDNALRAVGELIADDGKVYPISTNGRFRVPAGKYKLHTGTETRNGNLYHPVDRQVEIAPVGETIETVVLDVPPRIRVVFNEGGEPAQKISTSVDVFQNGVKLFHFRSKDIIYIDEGIYEFRANPNADNDLTVTATAHEGEETEVLFDLRQTVRMYARMFASGSNQRFRVHLQLYQDGEQKYNVHSGNGAQVLPGTYVIRMENELHSYETEIEVTNENNQEFAITVPVGHAIVRYQKADGSPDKQARCFTSKAGSNTTVFWNSDKLYPLRPGSYTVRGWRQKGDYESVTFEVREGEETEVILKAKG